MTEKTTYTREFRLKQAQEYLNDLTLLYNRQDFLSNLPFNYLWLENIDNAKDKTIFAFSFFSADHIAELAIEYNDKGYNVFVGTNPIVKPMKENKRPKIEDIAAQGVMVTDLTYKSAWHVDTANKKYPTIEQAQSFLPFEPTFFIDSGEKLQAHILLIEPIRLNTDAERKIAVNRTQNYIAVIREIAKKQGYSGCVGVNNLPKVVHLPGTYNLNHGRDYAPLCQFISADGKPYTGEMYCVEDLDNLIEKSIQNTQKNNLREFIQQPK